MRDDKVLGLDVVDADAAHPNWLETIGDQYINGRQVTPDKVDDHFGRIDLIFESIGVAALEFNLLDALAPNGVYMLTGIPGGDHPLEIDGAELIREWG